MAASTPAAAAIVESVSVTNAYSYAFNDDPLTALTTGAGAAQLDLTDGRPNPTSRLGIDYVGEASDGGFFFRHDDYCAGRCRVTSSTSISFTLFNSGATDQALRFDSLITPGLLAGAGIASLGSAFAFTVEKAVGGVTSTLYSAIGIADIDRLSIDTGTGPAFNGLTRSGNAADGYTLGWGATDLSIGLGTLAAGATMEVTYRADYSVYSDLSCMDVLNCTAARVVFGDPRNNGGGSEIASKNMALAAFSDMAFADPAVDPIIDGGVYGGIKRDYEATYVPYAFVPTGSEEDARLTSAVPEPTTWATMMLGFAVIGRALRRRRAGFGKVVA